MKIDFAENENILYCLELRSHPNMQPLMCPLTSHNTIKPVIQSLYLLIGFLKEFLAVRFVLHMSLASVILLSVVDSLFNVSYHSFHFFVVVQGELGETCFHFFHWVVRWGGGTSWGWGLIVLRNIVC